MTESVFQSENETGIGDSQSTDLAKKHLSVDIETMGGPPNGALISIGAVYFDIRTGTLGAQFSVNIDLQSSVLRGMTTDDRTIEWWNKPSNAEALGLTSVNMVSLPEALMQFMNWIAENRKQPMMWGNGSAFDNVILNQAFKLCDLHFPSHYRQWRDMRTWTQELGKDLLGLKKKDFSYLEEDWQAHVALDDAIRQARIISEIYKVAESRIQFGSFG